jgi:hypothetical protein
MEPNYLIFAEEHTGDHFFYLQGQEHCVRIVEHSKFTTNIAPYIDPVVLQDALNSKKRIFTHNKTRYVVVARGRTYEP